MEKVHSLLILDTGDVAAAFVVVDVFVVAAVSGRYERMLHVEYMLQLLNVPERIDAMFPDRRKKTPR